MAKRLTLQDVKQAVREEIALALEFQEWELRNQGYPEWVNKLWKRMTPMDIPLQPSGKYDFRAVAFQIVSEYEKMNNEEKENK